MMRRSIFAVGVLALAVIAWIVYLGSSPATRQALPAADEYRFMSTHCWFEIPWQETIRCGELHAPLSSGGFILPVVIIEDTGYENKTDAVFYLQGGPGASAGLHKDGIAYWLRWRNNMALGRDLILMDPRGTGRSQPQLHCRDYDELSLAVLKRNTLLLEELQEGYAVLDRCFDQLRNAQQPFNPEHYGTQHHARDVNALMDLLPYEQWNLIGVSYGTRVAIEAAKISARKDTQEHHPVRSMILDSVYPANRGGVTSFPAVLDRAFTNFFEWCSRTDTCATDQPVEQALAAALKQLRAAPVTLTVPRRDGEIPVDLVVNDHRFMSAVFSALYSKHQWPRIPAAIHAVFNNDAPALLPLMEPFVESALDEDFYSLVFMAVDCRDHGISSREAYQQALEAHPRWRNYTADLWQYQACHLLPTASTPIASTTALPDVPTLILAGELDPITPVEWAQSLHHEWPGSQLHVVPETGHAVINTDDCVYQSLRSFLDEPSERVEFCPKR